MIKQSSKKTATCGERLVQWLEYFGIDTVFGIPGVHTVELYRGLPNTKIRHITPRHEQGAGFMADGHYRASGKVAACFIITGPGMTNIMTAMAQARADSVPMLVISSVNKVADTGSGEGHLHEVADQQGMVSHVSAYSKTLWQAKDLPKILAEAFAFFASSRPQPVHIQIPIDVITSDATSVPIPPKSAWIPPKPAMPNSQSIDQAVALLLQAEKPVILLGGGAIHVTTTHLVSAIESISAPTFLTINAKGLLPAHHPLNMGSTQSLPAGRQLIADADVVLAVGTELGETDYDVLFDDGFAINGTLIRIDIDPKQLNKPFVAQLAICSDAASAVSMLATTLAMHQEKQNIQEHTSQITQKNEALQQLKYTLSEQIPSDYTKANRLLELIRQALPSVIFVGDSTQPVYAGNLGYDADAPRRWFNSSTGYGTLGYGLPAAIGASLATDNPVVCLIGDGGLQFSLSELIVASELQLPLIILVWNNSGYGEIRRYMQDADLPLIGVNIKTPDFKAVAKGLGVDYEQMTSVDQLNRVIKRVGVNKQPVLLEVHEDVYFD